MGGAPPLEDARSPRSADTGAPAPDAPPRWSPRRRRLLALGLTALLVAPFVVGIVSTRDPRWYPTHDLALFELKVRDVWSTDVPLIGLAGRFGDLGPDQGSHPGALVFYALAVPYALLGGSAWALQAATFLLQVGGAAAVLWLGWRRRGPGLALGLAAVTAVLTHAYGAEALGEPWLPYLPVLWFVAFVLAVWSVTDGDLIGLPVAVVTGSLCVQTHVSYAGTVGAAGVVAVGAAAWWLRDRRRAPAPVRRRDRRAVVLAAAAGVLVWLPPVVEQLGGGAGNLGILIHHFRYPPEPVVGPGDGLDLLLVLLDPWRLVSNSASIGGFPTTGSLVPGIALLAAECVAVVAAWRLRHHSLLRLHGVLLVLVVAAGVSLSRIIGTPYDYLTLWVWAICALLLLAIGWTVAVCLEAAGARRPPLRAAAARIGAVALVVVTAGYALDLGLEAARMPVSDARLSDLVAGVAPATVERLERGDVPGGGRDGRYLVTWTDPVNSVAQPSFGLFDELEREGFDVGVAHYYRVPFPHRAVDPDEVTAEIHFSAGADIREWRARGDAVEVASLDPRDDEERAAFTRLEQQLAAELRGAGRDDLAGQVADVAPLFAEPSLRPDQRIALARLAELGVPVAVFVAPPPR